ncbi:hypothetical protein COLO4_08224 [Corchorus olitorius]|uniref:Uncharacterized protein n=1 Tax=Corchorus olitorius TaxID=93759 RepID=A0A1R3KGY3_9ROSI|nr:hypothetical protein COLO4_08224 [Corchorus olitorius]
MHHHQNSLKLSDKWEDDYGSGNRHGRDYWHARRAFLNSYHFREQEGLKDKLKRSIKELNETALCAISKYCGDLSKRSTRVGVKVFRVKFGFPSLGLVSMRCFIPWLNKKRLDVY